MKAGWSRAQNSVVSPPTFVKEIIDCFMIIDAQNVSSVFSSKIFPLLYGLDPFSFGKKKKKKNAAQMQNHRVREYIWLEGTFSII